jgi:hypothetical protein
MNVGAGIVAKMAAEGDHPLCDSKYETNSDGTVFEKCYGTKGTYVASNASGKWEVVFFSGFLA